MIRRRLSLESIIDLQECGALRELLLQSLVGQMPQISLQVLHQLFFFGEELDGLGVLVDISGGHLVFTRGSESKRIVYEGILTLFLHEESHFYEVLEGEIPVIDLRAVDKLEIVKKDEAIFLRERSLQD